MTGYKATFSNPNNYTYNLPVVANIFNRFIPALFLAHSCHHFASVVIFVW